MILYILAFRRARARMFSPFIELMYVSFEQFIFYECGDAKHEFSNSLV